MDYWDILYFMNIYGIIIDLDKIRWCNKRDCWYEIESFYCDGTLSEHCTLVNWNEFGQYISQLLRQNDIRKLINKFVYKLNLKKIDEFSEERYEDIKNYFFYQACALSKSRFLNLINFLMIKIGYECKLLLYLQEWYIILLL